MSNIFNSEDNVGSAPNKPRIERLYEVSREDTSKPLGSDFAERSMLEREEEGITYGAARFDFFINETIPADVRERYPTFVSFVEYFYKWLHEENKVSGLEVLRDIELAETQFLIYYKNMLARDFPESPRLQWSDPSNSPINVRTLLRHIRELYLSKGTEESIEFFFRCLFAPIGTDIYRVQVDYPKKRLLRLSDGVWRPGASGGSG
jgi:hypothetical protein